MNTKQITFSLAVISVIISGLGSQGCSVTSKNKNDGASKTDGTVKNQVEAAVVSDNAGTTAPFFIPASTKTMTPDGKGFIRRWLLLEPISKPNRSNTVFTDSYIRTAFTSEYFQNQFTVLPRDGEKVKAGDQELTWHALESTSFNVKLFRFAYDLKKQVYGVVFWAVTIVNSPREMKNVRMAVGSNSASMWWLNENEAVILSGDRRMVMDDCVSPRLTLNKGKNIIRGAVINGPGMSDFCVRFIDEKGEPVKDLIISCE
jgi:hypothetical protein